MSIQLFMHVDASSLNAPLLSAAEFQQHRSPSSFDNQNCLWLLVLCKKKNNKQTEAVQQVIIDWHENHLHDHETRDVGLIVDHAPSGTSNAGMTTMPQNPPVYSNVNF